MSFFKFLFLLYVTFIVFSGKICGISWLLCNTSKYSFKTVLILGSIGLYCVIKFDVVEKLPLILGLLASSLEIFLTSENCFLTLLGLYIERYIYIYIYIPFYISYIYPCIYLPMFTYMKNTFFMLIYIYIYIYTYNIHTHI